MKPSKAFLGQEMRRYLRSVPDAAPEEIAELKEWVEAGNDPYCNPLHIADEHGVELPFIHGLRVNQKLCEMEEKEISYLPESLSNPEPF